MARITQYPEETSPSANDVVLIDGVNGSRKVKIQSILNGIVAPVETSSTSSRAYAVGDQFIFNGVTTEATAAIAQGETIVVSNSGNAKVADCVLDQISQLKDALNQKIGEYNFLQTSGATSPSVINFPSGTKELFIEAGAAVDPRYVMVHGCVPISVAKKFISSPYWNFGNFDGTNRFYVTIDVSGIENNSITVSWPSNVTTPAIYYR